MFDLDLLLGMVGSVVLLAAFALNLAGKIGHESPPYVASNAVGCVFTAYYALVTNSLPFLVLEVTWGAVAFYKLAVMLHRGLDAKK